MRRDVVARVPRFAGRARLDKLIQLANLRLQQIYLPLLAKYRAIEFFDMVFAQAQLDFEFRDSGFHARSPVVQ